MHGADALKLGRFSGEIVKAVLVKGWLVKELLSPWCVAADPEPPLLLAVEEAEERKESPQLSGKKVQVEIAHRSSHKTCRTTS